MPRSGWSARVTRGHQGECCKTVARTRVRLRRANFVRHGGAGALSAPRETCPLREKTCGMALASTWRTPDVFSVGALEMVCGGESVCFPTAMDGSARNGPVPSHSQRAIPTGEWWHSRTPETKSADMSRSASAFLRSSEWSQRVSSSGARRERILRVSRETPWRLQPVLLQKLLHALIVAMNVVLLCGLV
jgi:hypothetical protein